MVKNTSDSCGKPPGLEAKVRKSGLLSRLAQNGLEGSFAAGATVFHRYAVLTTDFVIKHGEYPESYSTMSYDDYSPKMREEVARELCQRALGKGSGRALGTTQAVLTQAPWFPQLFASVLSRFKDFEMAWNPLLQLKKVYCVPAKQTEGLRAFVVPSDTTSKEIHKYVVSKPNTLLLAQGGGSLYKEKRVFPASVIFNREKDTDLGQLKSSMKDGCHGVVSINCQTQKGTISNGELMSEYMADAAVTVVPDGRVEVNTNKRARRRAEWEVTDDLEKVKYWHGRIDAEGPLKINRGEDALFFDFKPLSLQGIRYCKSNPREGYAAVNAKFFPKMKIPTKDFKGKHSIKPKYDGIPHFFVARGGYFKLYPRCLDMELNKDSSIVEKPIKEVFFMTGECKVNCSFTMELVDGLMHIIKVYDYGPFSYKVDSLQRNLALQGALTINWVDNTTKPVDGAYPTEELKFCMGSVCECAIDGIIVVSDNGAETPFKEDLEQDVFENNDGNGLQKFVTNYYDRSVLIATRVRLMPERFKKAFNPQIMTTPHPTVVVPGYPGYKAKHSKAFSIEFKFNWRLSEATCRDYEQGCKICSRATTEVCSHGSFCHSHGCDACLRPGARCSHFINGERCEDVNTVHCPLSGNFHCALHSCRIPEIC